ncbi:Alpha-galactosidase A precursor [Pirellulimonas nuda]|uniref:Alpha-galactosidase n=1 Tax=Pirellulimonas nuda TaxID=2528009 RepID=A0A518DHU2_9BACT|nr:glycoside hydrolase family 27 protein [Pirellulimonas nuda]QDU91034.1 Alpha-galactosidase A precursor [Pirellulimonas nuda]
MHRCSYPYVLFTIVVFPVLAIADPAGPVAQRPPMGWNSFDSYDCRINEHQFRGVVDWLADRMAPLGYEYAVIDYIWFNPNPGAWDNPERRLGHPNLRLDAQGRPVERLTLDRWGRPLPSVERFPSAEGGKGFGPIADYVHGKGMKFGIHIMRGIPRQAYYDDLPIKGTDTTARDIAEPFDTCEWCNNMYGVDPSKPGAQAYYDSLMELYASWGVDFIKADDTMYPPYHAGEIEMMRKAIDKCGRPMVLSLSCGEAPLSRARHLVQNANMWRVSADFWDNWQSLEHSFDLLGAWSGWAGPGHWPDADMLPVGHISLGGRPHGPDRQSQFTPDEHRTLMTLWCVARSPLMWGGDPLTSSEESIAYLTNADLLHVNQHTTDNREVFHESQKACWVAADEASGDRYVALFNLGETPAKVALDLERESLRGTYRVRDLWERRDLPNASKRVSATLPPHGAAMLRLSPAETTDP